jgi:uncharacterized protein YbjT (DUF2867 family)
MADKRLLVVFGATGKQGGSVIKSILDDPVTAAQYSIRGITRDPSKPAAQELAASGVECVRVFASTSAAVCLHNANTF